MRAYQAGKIYQTAVSMHFVPDDGMYDGGPIFFEYRILIRESDTAESLGERVNKIEHGWQSWITNLVLQEEITWDGSNPKTLCVPAWYHLLPH